MAAKNEPKKAAPFLHLQSQNDKKCALPPQLASLGFAFLESLKHGVSNEFFIEWEMESPQMGIIWNFNIQLLFHLLILASSPKLDTLPGEMLEFLLFLLASSETNDFFANQDVAPLPRIEIFEPAELPQKKRWAVEPQLLSNPATAVLAADIKSGKIIYKKKIDRSQPIASLTKIMTAFIILENHDLDDVVSIPLSSTEVGGAMIGLYEHEKLTVRTLLEAALIPSANDAAVALAVYDAGSEAEFVVKMNQKARELGLKSAQFYNSTGLDIFDPEKNESYGNKMSPRDMAKLARMALANPFFKKTVRQSHFYGKSVDEKFFHEKATTNQLLGTFLNLKGVKTGYTYLAGQCFVALGEDSEGHEILTVVLGSRDRFGETKTLLSWIYDSFEWR